MVDPVGRRPVPYPEIGQQRLQYQPRKSAHPFLGRVLVKPPDIARWRQTVTDVGCVWPCNHAVAESTFVADYQVKAGEIELFERRRIEGKIKLLAAVGPG